MNIEITTLTSITSVRFILNLFSSSFTGPLKLKTSLTLLKRSALSPPFLLTTEKRKVRDFFYKV